MLIRLSGWGLALLAASSLASVSPAQAQDSNSVDVPPPAAPATPESSDAPPPVQRLPNPDPRAREQEIEDRSIARSRRQRPVKVEEADPWKKHPPIWSIRDDSHTTHPYANPSQPAPGIGHFPGGPTGRWGFPYYYTRTSPDTAYGQVAGAAAFDDGSGPGGHFGPMGYGQGGPMGPAPAGGFGGGAPCCNHGAGAAPVSPGYGAGYAGPEYGPGYGPGYGAPQPYGPGPGPGYGPGGFGPAVAALPGQLPGNPYLYHFGPGFYRYQEAGHYSFPYYSYRRPWYFPGHPSYNRDTNVPW